MVPSVRRAKTAARVGVVARRSGSARNCSSRPRLCASIVDLLLRAKRQKPRRSVRRLIAILERAGRVPKGSLSRSTVHRLLVTHGVSGRPSRAQTKERRSFLVEHGGDLWMGDAMHGPRVRTASGLRKSYLLSIMDAATRAMVSSAFFLGEGARPHEQLLMEALRVHGRPRVYRGSAPRRSPQRLHFVSTSPDEPWRLARTREDSLPREKPVIPTV